MCCYIDDIIELEYFDVDNILIDEQSQIYNISNKTLTGTKTFPIRFDEIAEFI